MEETLCLRRPGDGGGQGRNGGKKGQLVLCFLGASYRARRQKWEKRASFPTSVCAKAWDFFHRRGNCLRGSSVSASLPLQGRVMACSGLRCAEC
jgi:hypothetical protein